MLALVIKNFKIFFYIKKRDNKNKSTDASIDVSNLNHTVLKDIEYFHKNLGRSDTNQIVNYTWEKPSNESPSTYKKIEEVKVNGSVVASTYQNTLDLMAPYKGIPHAVKQNKWETDPSDPPKFLPYPQHRRTANQSAMTQ